MTVIPTDNMLGIVTMTNNIGHIVYHSKRFTRMVTDDPSKQYLSVTVITTLI